jgi:hypothetical protein
MVPERGLAKVVVAVKLEFATPATFSATAFALARTSAAAVCRTESYSTILHSFSLLNHQLLHRDNEVCRYSVDTRLRNYRDGVNSRFTPRATTYHMHRYSLISLPQCITVEDSLELGMQSVRKHFGCDMGLMNCLDYSLLEERPRHHTCTKPSITCMVACDFSWAITSVSVLAIIIALDLPTGLMPDSMPPSGPHT